MRTIEYAGGYRSADQYHALCEERDSYYRAQRVQSGRSQRNSPVTEAQVSAIALEHARRIAYVRVIEAEVN
jgi:hypothetical protein